MSHDLVVPPIWKVALWQASDASTKTAIKGKLKILTAFQSFTVLAGVEATNDGCAKVSRWGHTKGVRGAVTNGTANILHSIVGCALYRASNVKSLEENVVMMDPIESKGIFGRRSTYIEVKSNSADVVVAGADFISAWVVKGAAIAGVGAAQVGTVLTGGGAAVHVDWRRNII